MMGLGLIGLLKFRNGDKLHLSNGPGIWTWFFSIGLAALGLTFAVLATDCIVEKCFSIVASFVLALMSTGDWKDCVLDRSKIMVTITRCNWYGRLSSQVSAPDTTMFSLRSVSSVDVRGEALVLVLFSNETIVIGKHSNPEHLQHLREEVASFLRVGRVECLPSGKLEDYWSSVHYWAAMDAAAETLPVPTMQHSGVKVLVQPDPDDMLEWM